MPNCGRCHTCGQPVLIVLDGVEWCPHTCLIYQWPLSHGWPNPAPTADEALSCEQVAQRLTPSAAHSKEEEPLPITTSLDPAPSNIWADAPIISTYTRRQAIEDGCLIEIPPETCREFGIRFSLALTRAVWEEYVVVPPAVKGFQDEAGRLANILTMFYLAARRCSDHMLTFQVIVKQDAEEDLPPPITLKAGINGGDDGRGAITIMLLNES